MIAAFILGMIAGATLLVVFAVVFVGDEDRGD